MQQKDAHMDIKRDRYLQRIIARKHNGLVKVITGIRRCGKSYLLFNLFRKHLTDGGVDDRHVIGVNLEDKEFASLRNPNKLLTIYPSVSPPTADGRMFSSTRFRCAERYWQMV